MATWLKFYFLKTWCQQWLSVLERALQREPLPVWGRPLCHGAVHPRFPHWDRLQGSQGHSAQQEPGWGSTEPPDRPAVQLRPETTEEKWRSVWTLCLCLWNEDMPVDNTRHFISIIAKNVILRQWVKQTCECLLRYGDRWWLRGVTSQQRRKRTGSWGTEELEIF